MPADYFLPQKIEIIRRRGPAGNGYQVAGGFACFQPRMASRNRKNKSRS
jgi:hypothetical protein